MSRERDWTVVLCDVEVAGNDTGDVGDDACVAWRDRNDAMEDVEVASSSAAVFSSVNS